jgi:protein-S-isoprenylcysteine O-methyltransferase Ste14
MKKVLRHIAGYLTGATFFLFLLPLGFFELSKLDYLNGYTTLINSSVLKIAVAFLLLLTGLSFVIWSNIYLLIIGKGGHAEAMGMAISPATTKLVTSGPYRYSRNPMVFGALSVYLSLVIYMNSLTGLICLLILTILAHSYLKFSEEKRLLKDFGEDYAAYRKKVPMIFPVKLFKKRNINRST